MTKRVPAIFQNGETRALIPPDTLEYVASIESGKFLCNNDINPNYFQGSNLKNDLKTSPMPATNELLICFLDGCITGSSSEQITMIAPSDNTSYGTGLSPLSSRDSFSNRELTNATTVSNRAYSTAFAYYPKYNTNGTPMSIRWSGTGEKQEFDTFANVLSFPGHEGYATKYKRGGTSAPSVGSFTDVTDMFDSITVQANSKVLIIVSFHHLQTTAINNRFKIVDSTGSPVDLLTTSNTGLAGSLTHHSVTYCYLTSALSAGSHSYKVQINTNSGTTSINQYPQIFLYEIPSTAFASSNATVTTPTTTDATLSELAVTATGYKRYFLWSGYNVYQQTAGGASLIVRYVKYDGATETEISPLKRIGGLAVTSSPPGDFAYAWVTPRIDMTTITHLRLKGARTSDDVQCPSNYGFIAVELPDR